MTTTTSEQVLAILSRAANPVVARGVMRFALHQCGITSGDLDRQRLSLELVDKLTHGFRVMSSDEDSAQLCRRELLLLLHRQNSPKHSGVGTDATRRNGPRNAQEQLPPQPRIRRTTIEIREEVDVVRARAAARDLAESAGFSRTDRTKIATAVSEVSRNILVYAREGTVTIMPLATGRGLRVEARDQGPGIANLDTILAGEYKSKMGMGLGLLGCKRIMNHFQVKTGQGTGTVVIMEKELV